MPIGSSKRSLPGTCAVCHLEGQLVQTQQVLNKKFMGWIALGRTLGLAAGFLAEGQTNFVKMPWKSNSVYNYRHRLPIIVVKFDMPCTCRKLARRRLTRRRSISSNLNHPAAQPTMPEVTWLWILERLQRLGP